MRHHFGPIALVLALVTVTAGQAPQYPPAVEHARRIINLLAQQKFDDVSTEFNTQLAATVSPSQLRDAWNAFGQQTGQFKSFIDARVTTTTPAVTVVIVGCQFERGTLNVIVAFDVQDKIAGLRLTPRPAPSEPPAAPPPGSRFKEEEVTVGANGWPLPGTLSMPLEGAAVPAVVLVHGSGPSDRDETVGPNKPFRDLAWGLANRGIAVLRYEKRTRQYPDKVAVDRSLTVREEVIDDALAAAAALRKHERIDPKRVFVLGHSLGGTLAPRIAADDPALAGIVIMSGTTRPLLEVAREQLAYLATLNSGSLDPDKAVEQLRRAAPEAYWKDLDSYNPAAAAAKLTVPTLILHGDRDYQVTSRDLQGWRDAIGSRPNVTIKSYPTLNHLFQPGEGKSTPAEYDRAGHMPDFVLDDIAAWIKQTR